ncbi:MAG: hypothetical protein Q9225_002479 [Loekoesia sp. 1 TL-2023]
MTLTIPPPQPKRLYTIDLERDTANPDALNAIKAKLTPHRSPGRSRDSLILLAKLFYAILLLALIYLLIRNIIHEFGKLVNALSAAHARVEEERVFPRLDPAAPNHLDGGRYESSSGGKE